VKCRQIPGPEKCLAQLSGQFSVLKKTMSFAPGNFGSQKRMRHGWRMVFQRE
jgi:hypothetical protein